MLLWCDTQREYLLWQPALVINWYRVVVWCAVCQSAFAVVSGLSVLLMPHTFPAERLGMAVGLQIRWFFLATKFSPSLSAFPLKNMCIKSNNIFIHFIPTFFSAVLIYLATLPFYTLHLSCQNVTLWLDLILAMTLYLWVVFLLQLISIIFIFMWFKVHVYSRLVVAWFVNCDAKT